MTSIASPLHPRDKTLNDFLSQLRQAFDQSSMGPGVKAVVEAQWAALALSGSARISAPEKRTVCDHLPGALDFIRHAPPHLADLAPSLALLWPTLSSSGPNASENWPEGHANAVIVGRGGLEERDDIAIGLSLLAPHVRYPDRTHAPEDAYLVLTPGRFKHGTSDWFEPGVGGTLHNTSNILHAMASDETPLFALWCHLTTTKAQG